MKSLSNSTLGLPLTESLKVRKQHILVGLCIVVYSMDINLCKLWDMVAYRRAQGVPVHGVANSWTQLSN